MRVMQVLPTLGMGGARRDRPGLPARARGARRQRGPPLRPRPGRGLHADRPDVLHTHTHVLRYVLPALALGRARPIVHTIHNLATRDVDWPGLALQFVSFRLGVSAVAIGEAVATSFERAYRLAPRCIIPNGIPVSE